jgi:anti-anti-sigma regulatory factor
VKKKKPPAAPAPQSGSPQSVQLAARMSIAQSPELHRTLADRLAAGAPLLIDGGQVEQIDTAVLQLLVGAWRGAASRGIERRWLGASPALHGAANLIGVADLLQLNSPEVRPAS